MILLAAVGLCAARHVRERGEPGAQLLRRVEARTLAFVPLSEPDASGSSRSCCSSPGSIFSGC